MPKKGHTCCVLGCTVNSKKTVLADGRRPRFFCFPHEVKRPHLRRAWLALTRRTEASTNTRVCEFHFVDGKPSAINPHPILNMGMEATKMQKRAIELRQQKELRKMIMQQQMAGQLLAGQQGEMEGVLMVGKDGGVGMVSPPSSGETDDMLQEQGTYPYIPQIENPYVDHIKMETGEDDDGSGVPSQIGFKNPVPHGSTRQESEMDAMQPNGGPAEGSLSAQTGLNLDAHYTADEVAKNLTELQSGQNQQEPSTSEAALPEDCSKITPLNAPQNTTPCPSRVSPTSTGIYPTAITAAGGADTPPTAAAIVTDTKKPQGAMNLVNEANKQSNSPQEGNTILQKVGSQNFLPLIGSQNGLPLIGSQNGLPSGKSTPLKVPSWQLRINGTASTNPSGASAAKRPRKRKATPSMKSPLNMPGSVPGMMNNIPNQLPKSLNQSNILMSMHTVESLKSDILENLRAEFLTELQQESESNKQLQVEMETIRLQTRQELQQMRVELHALWGENQRLRAQVESLLQEKESNVLNN